MYHVDNVSEGLSNDKSVSAFQLATGPIITITKIHSSLGLIGTLSELSAGVQNTD